MKSGSWGVYMHLDKIAALFKKKRLDLQAQYNWKLPLSLSDFEPEGRVTNLNKAAVYPTWTAGGRRYALKAPGKVEAALWRSDNYLFGYSHLEVSSRD